jgi:hypothetical protein
MNRGMKKWAPYKSLNEQADFINKMYYEKHKIERPKISNEVAEDINYILLNYNNEDELKITYYDDGYVYTIIKIIYKIDVNNKRLYLDRTSYISFENLLNLEK